jgi:sarcosine reductase
MRLELANYPVHDIQLTDHMAYADGTLYVDATAVREHILARCDFDDVQLAVVRPGEETRVIHIVDAVEPRWKPSGSAFPGYLGPRTGAGTGRVHRLGGMAILTTSDAVAGEALYWREAIVDMAGLGARLTPFGGTVNLVVQLQPRREYQDERHPEAASLDDSMIGSPLLHRYGRSLREAQCELAITLARTTEGLRPVDVEVFELTPPTTPLPRVVYIFQIARLSVYGQRADITPPTIMHPNEILDSALVSVQANAHAAHRYVTYLNQNHGIVRELYARHGRDLNFAGVITYPATMNDLNSKDAVAETVVELARSMGANGAVLNYYGGGHPAVEFMLICQKAEQAGIKTVLVMPEAYGTPDDPGFVHYVQEAVAIVSTGRHTQSVQLPAMQRVIGGEHFFDLPDAPGGELKLPLRYLYAGCTSTGSGRLTARQY